MNEEGPVSLDLLERSALRKRARNVGVAAVVVGAACGGIVGLFSGPLGFLVTTGVLALPLLLLAYSESRKTY